MMTVLLLIADDNDSDHCVDGVRVIVVVGDDNKSDGGGHTVDANNDNGGHGSNG